MKRFTKNRVMSPDVQEKLYHLLDWSFDREDKEVRRICADLYTWLGTPIGDIECAEDDNDDERIPQ
jgi:hypothetical protein